MKARKDSTYLLKVRKDSTYLLKVRKDSNYEYLVEVRSESTRVDSFVFF